MASTEQSEAESLLNALDPLPYPQRMRQLALRVREMTSLRPVLEELEGHGAHGRGIAVVAAAVGSDTEWVADRITDPDSFVRGHALRVADSLQVPDMAFESGLQDASEVVRRDLLRAIVTGGRTTLADRLVDGLRTDRGDAEAALLLPGCTAPTVVRLLPELFHAVRSWTTLAKRHPGTLLEVAERELTDLPEALRDTWWTRYAHAMAVVTAADPLCVLDLLEHLGPATLPLELRDRTGVFALADPQRVLRLLLTPAWSDTVGIRTLSPAALRRLARSDTPELVAYGRTLAPHGTLPPLLKALPPARRRSFRAAVEEGRGVGHATVDEAVLEALPRSCVAAEARKAAAVARERDAHWSVVLRAEAFLPVAEVRERLVEATRRPVAEERATAWPLLIRNAARSADPAAVTAVLQDMGRLRSEQDPVRSAALRALADTPAGLFTADAEPGLDRVAVDAVEARDSSPDTRRLLSGLALAVLREHAAGGAWELVNWALRTLVRISGHTGGADLGRLDRTLRRGQEHQVYEALRPWIEAGAEKADYSLAFALARAVGRRAAGMTELQDLLWQAVRYGNDATVRAAVALWLEPPATRDERVARILAHDPSAAVLVPVRRIVARRRTDLLDLLLADTPPYGRFLTKDTPWSVPVDRDVRRWVPRQQLAVLRQLATQIEDSGLPLQRRAGAVAQAALVPDGGADLVRRWTGVLNVVLAEAALGALVRTDRPADTVSELLAHAGGERARVAMYAATRASRYARPSRLAVQLAELLRTPDAKVTSRKEAVRLAAARLPLPQAAGLFSETYARPGCHRDVRAACVAFAGPLLGREEVWELLGDAAGAEPVLRRAVLRVGPLDLPEPHRERYAGLVLAVSATEDPETAPLALDALARWAAWAPDAPTVLAGALTDLADLTRWYAAARGLVTVAVDSVAGRLGLRQALRTLAETTDEADAEERLDRPARRRVEHVVECLEDRAMTAPDAVRPVALAVGALLAEYDAYVPQAAGIEMFHLDLGAVPPRLDRLAALTEGRPVLAADMARELGRRLKRRPQDGDPEVLLAEAGRLTRHGGHAEGLLAVAVTEAFGSRTAWAEPWRERLRELRRHLVADVRDAALKEVTAYL